MTSVTTQSSGLPPPVNFQLGNPPVYYEIETTATFTGDLSVCIDYSAVTFNNESFLSLFHLEAGVWVDRTSSIDTGNNIICGTVTSLSPFAVFQRTYQFTGFFQPVDNIPTLNLMNAGRAVPVKFSLNGNQGLNIFAAGHPKSQAIACETNVPVGNIEETSTAGQSGLTYDPDTDQYTYVWKTEKGWSGTCRQLIIKFSDGTMRSANFKFTR
jgi:hypothetical protein